MQTEYWVILLFVVAQFAYLLGHAVATRRAARQRAAAKFERMEAEFDEMWDRVGARIRQHNPASDPAVLRTHAALIAELRDRCKGEPRKPGPHLL